MREEASFRHNPACRIVPIAQPGSFHWDREPVVAHWKKLEYNNRTLARVVAVPVSSTPAVVPGVGVILASDDGFVRFYDEKLTTVFWERRINASVYASLVLDHARRAVIVCSTKGQILSLDLHGHLRWAIELEAPVFATPVIEPDSGLMLIAAFHHKCFGIDLDEGAVRFEQNLPSPWHAPFAPASYRDPYASPTVTPDGSFVICSAEHVTCLDPGGGLRWRRDLSHSIKASPAVCHRLGLVVAPLVNGDLWFLDARTGASEGRIQLEGKLIQSPAISQGVLICGSQFGQIFGIDMGAIKSLWRQSTGAPQDYTSFTTLPDGNFAFTSSRGNILALGRDGRFLWESSQVMGMSGHDARLDITPVAAPNGAMYCASYSGFVYKFQFRPI